MFGFCSFGFFLVLFFYFCLFLKKCFKVICFYKCNIYRFVLLVHCWFVVFDGGYLYEHVDAVILRFSVCVGVKIVLFYK